MPSLAQSREPFRLDERNHIEKPLLDQLAGLGWASCPIQDEPGGNLGKVD